MVGDLTPYDVPFSCCNYQIMCVYIYIYIYKCQFNYKTLSVILKLMIIKVR